ncbi:MAG: glycosyltransferase family 4 protein [Acidobacteriota bacterium]
MTESGQGLKVAYIAAGAGGMICGSCIRDNALVSELQREGLDALLIPIYTPLRTDEENVSSDRVFYGAINIYLQQKAPWLAKLPGVLRHLLDAPKLLSWVAGSADSTNAKELGALTLSMLQGESGRQKKELEELVLWLRDSYKPDIVVLTNSMLLGMARSLRDKLPGARILCALQGEDIFLDDLDEPWRTRVHDQLKARAKDCHLFLTTCDYYGEYMSDFLDIPAEKIHVARLGINLQGFARSSDPPAEPFTVGYLARICPEKGLHHLIEAFAEVVREIPTAQLRIAGYLGGRDTAYAERLRRRIKELDLETSVDWVGEVDRQGKIDFLSSLHAFSVPTEYREPKGLSILEALAVGVPVVLPEHGAFPEILERSGGGLLFPPGDDRALAEQLVQLSRDADLREQLGSAGCAGVARHFDVSAMARATIEGFEKARGLGAVAT